MHLQPPFDVCWHNKEGFAHNMPDDKWMEVVGPRGWIVFSQDWKFHIRDVELEAVKQHNIKCFYLPGSGATKWATYCQLIRSHARLIEIAQNEAPPFIYDVKRNGHLKRIVF